MTASLWLWADGVLSDGGQSAANLDELSLQLPEGAYTTMRTYGGDRVVGLSNHLTRLETSLALVGGGRKVDGNDIRHGLRVLIERQGLPEVRLRITVPFVGSDVLIAAEPLVVFPEEYYTRGVLCRSIPMERKTPEAKTTAFIAPARAIKAAADPEIHELIRIDSQGHMLEGLSSNFFAVKQGMLFTAKENILDGVTRRVVLGLASEVVPVILEPANLMDRGRLAEAFITSSTREVMPVVGIDGLSIGDGAPGPVSQQLLARYRAHLACDAERV